jgi:hypothetical protein
MNLDVSEIYSHLFAGKRLRLTFTSAEEAEKFRVRMAQYKAAQDRSMISVGMMSEEERQSLSFQVEQSLPLEEAGDEIIPGLPPTPKFVATLKFNERVPRKKYSVVILEDE